MFKEEWKSFRRAWIHHTGVQLATLTVLVATFTVVAFFITVSVNLKTILSHWGDSVQVTLYLSDDVTAEQVQNLQGVLEHSDDVSGVTYVPKERATELFREQMASYAPDLLQDSEFAHPFPASFQIGLKDGVQSQSDVRRLETMAVKFGKLEGVSDVSYGQSWVHNYSAFVNALSSGGWVVVFILVVTSLFVVGNAVRLSIASRREDVEILELVGATSAMIRKPFVFEGAMLGLIASGFSLLMNFGLYAGLLGLLKSSLAFTRLASEFTFLHPLWLVGLLALGPFIGGLGAYLTVRRINHGWAAAQGHKA